MTVYIDDMYRFPMGRFRRMKMSHMIADTEAELHAMADRIGIARRWYQGDHYDVAINKRVLAVRFGAIEVSLRQLSVMSLHRRRTGGALPALADVPALTEQLMARVAARVAQAAQEKAQ